MKFYIPINEAEEGGSVTMHCVDTESNSPRTNKRKLREYFLYMGVAPKHIKSTMKMMGFVGDSLSPGALKRVVAKDLPKLKYMTTQDIKDQLEKESEHTT
jgi:hypothetical protein